jgi:hypothetical protein
MTAAPPLVVPGSRVLQGWWRELAGVHPGRLWFAHLLLHRVEVLVETAVALPLANLSRALLEILAHRPSACRTSQLAGELHADRDLLQELLGELAQRGLVRPAAAGEEAGWEVVRPADSPTAPAAPTRQERRSFFFTDASPPLYLPLTPGAATPMTPPGGWRFDLAVLDTCLARTPEWKSRHGFPLDVLKRIAGSPNEDWRGVALDRAEQSVLLLAEVEDSGAILGFPVRVDGWRLILEPALSLRCGREVLAPLLEEVGPESWKQAWQAWCQQRSASAGEVESCKLEETGHRLRVHAPPRLIDRLRAARSDALKGEAWLLAGTGRVRAAALIDLGEEASRERQ